MPSRDLQQEAMRIYNTLIDVREDWSGKLVLGCGSGCAGSGAPAAVSIAGGALLAVDSDAAAMKSAMRAGYLDFVVNTLDEALRTLKNEIRQKRPLSVGLIAAVEATLEEMVERGILPDLLLIASNQSAQPILQNQSIRALEAEGMSLRLTIGAEDVPLATRTMMFADRKYDEAYLPVAGAVELRTLDQRLLTIVPPGDMIRRRWIQRVPQYLREARSGGRWVWLTQKEKQQFDD